MLARLAAVVMVEAARMPEDETRARRHALAHRLAVVVALGGFAALAAAVSRRGPALFDTWLIAALAAADAPWVGSALGAISAVTGGIGIAAATAFVAAAMWRAHRRSSAFLLVGTGGAAVLNQLAKWTWARRRPGASAPQPAVPDDYAFPSGHAMLTMALALALWLVARRLRPRWQAPVAAAGGLVVLLVGVARVHLGKHYPTDVLAGWALGAAWVLLAHLWYARGQRPEHG